MGVKPTTPAYEKRPALRTRRLTLVPTKLYKFMRKTTSTHGRFGLARKNKTKKKGYTQCWGGASTQRSFSGREFYYGIIIVIFPGKRGLLEGKATPTDIRSCVQSLQDFEVSPLLFLVNLQLLYRFRYSLLYRFRYT